MIRDLPTDAYWSLAGVGDSQLPMNSIAIAMGGGVRVGLEDNIYFNRERTKLATNADLLGRIRGVAEANGRAIMSPEVFRDLLQLEPGQGKWGRSTEMLL